MSNKNFWQNLPKPIIGLAPMDGYTDSAFRHICKLVNPEIITITEFTAAEGLHHQAKKLVQKLTFHESEQPIIAQIFGKNSQSFITALKVCEDMGFSGIDINMGCPAKKVVRSEHGMALRKKPDLAYKLIETLATNTKLPVSVKTRLGWEDASDLLEFAKEAERSGADMISIHGRTFKEPYKVPANWEPIYEIKKEITIPVLGNGGITSLSDGLEKLQCLDGFLIGQASFGNPWVFDPKGSPNSFSEKVPLIKKHAELLITNKGERVGCNEIRKHLLQYVKGFRGAKAFRNKLTQVKSLTDIYNVLTEISNQEEIYGKNYSKNSGIK